jgi:hypothetical protein
VRSSAQQRPRWSEVYRLRLEIEVGTLYSCQYTSLAEMRMVGMVWGERKGLPEKEGWKRVQVRLPSSLHGVRYWVTTVK